MSILIKTWPFSYKYPACKQIVLKIYKLSDILAYHGFLINRSNTCTEMVCITVLKSCSYFFFNLNMNLVVFFIYRQKMAVCFTFFYSKSVILDFLFSAYVSLIYVCTFAKP